MKIQNSMWVHSRYTYARYTGNELGKLFRNPLVLANSPGSTVGNTFVYIEQKRILEPPHQSSDFFCGRKIYFVDTVDHEANAFKYCT